MTGGMPLVTSADQTEDQTEDEMGDEKQRASRPLSDEKRAVFYPDLCFLLSPQRSGAAACGSRGVRSRGAAVVGGVLSFKASRKTSRT